MNQNRFFMPNMAMFNPMMRNAYIVPRNPGIFSRITSGLKSFNWSGFLNGANRTLNVVNQTIPLIKQTRPMFHNMKKMVQLAKVFKRETSNNAIINDSRKTSMGKNMSGLGSNNLEKKEVINNNYPNFFI